jgi:ribosome assembly protein YihI (activator of Der GTPase)
MDKMSSMGASLCGSMADFGNDIDSLLMTLESKSTLESQNQAAIDYIKTDIDEVMDEINEEDEFGYVSDRAVGEFYEEFDQEDRIEYP